VDLGQLYLLPSTDEAIEADLREVDTAIELVSRGAARRVRLVGLRAPDEIAPTALARAQAAGVPFSLDRRGATRLTFGPVE
jgi:hypothetical protein